MLHKSQPGNIRTEEESVFLNFFLIIIGGLKFDIEQIELKIYCKSDPHIVFVCLFLHARVMFVLTSDCLLLDRRFILGISVPF